jgi:dynein intermediate chain
LFKNLFLTSSLDWTVKLWNTAQSLEEPLLQFFSPTYDYICGAQWSPSNASLFGTISSNGSVNLWNMSKSVLEPSETFHINSRSPALPGGGSKGAGAASLNKFSWLRDGRKMVVGDSAGSLYLLGMQDAAADAKLGDEAKFEHVLYSSRKSGAQ